MSEYKMTAKQIMDFGQYLRTQEREGSTIEKYLHDVREFCVWVDGQAIDKKQTAHWKEHLTQSGLAPATVNGKIAALNGFLDFAGWQEYRVKPLRIQRRLFRDPSRELTKAEYEKLVQTARRLHLERLALVIETICALGIRVSELRFVTVEALRMGRTEIALKGKIRTIMLPGKLCRKLLKYAKQQKIASGEVFLTRSGRSLSRKQIWAEMKALCGKAGVDATKVFPHNLRHLFARCFYHACRDIARLADVLGHSSIETTRIYLISSGIEHAKTLEALRLIL